MKKVPALISAFSIFLFSCQKDTKENLMAESTESVKASARNSTPQTNLAAYPGSILNYDFNNPIEIRVSPSLSYYRYEDFSGNFNDAIASYSATAYDRNSTTGYSVRRSSDSPSGTRFSIKIPDNLVFNNINAMSVSLWFYINGLDAGHSGVLFGYQNTPALQTEKPTQYVPCLYIGTDHKLHGLFWNSQNDKVMVSQKTISPDAWHHVVITTNANVQTLYLDGVKQDTKDGGGDALVMFYNQFGTGIGSYGGVQAYPNLQLGWSYFPGLLDDAQIYNFRLTDLQVNYLYIAQK